MVPCGMTASGIATEWMSASSKTLDSMAASQLFNSLSLNIL